MNFKIDTRDTFTVITPDTAEITVNLTGELQRRMEEMRQSGSQNFIIDLQHCTSVMTDAIEQMLAMHEESYSGDTSLVFTGVSANVMAALKEDDSHLSLNIAPKMIEAVDIISMEILERDLFNEES
jgi:anti-anti-sigma regulatory factor